VTAPVWDWGPYYVNIVEQIIDGTFTTESYWGGMETGLVSLYDLSSDVPSDTATLIAEKTEAIIDGTLEVEIVEEEFISNVIGTVNP
jgi:basic membrane protein A